MNEQQIAAARQAVRALRDRVQRLDDDGLDLILRQARTFNAWQDRPVPRETLLALFELMRMGPTSANCCPVRLIFVTTGQAKERLKPALASGNVEKTMAAPVCAIVAHDVEFWRHFGKLFPHRDVAGPYTDDPAAAELAALRNGTLQAGYLILAARALGLDCGPMSGFDNAAVDRAFFAGTAVRSNILCNLGYGEPDSLFARLPRFDFEEVCRIV